MQVDFAAVQAIFSKNGYEIAFRGLHVEEELEKYKFSPDVLDTKKFFTVLDPRGLTVCRLFSVEVPRKLQIEELKLLIETIGQYKIPNSGTLLEELKILLTRKGLE